MRINPTIPIPPLNTKIHGIRRLSRRTERVVLCFLRDYAMRSKRAANKAPSLEKLLQQSRAMRRKPVSLKQQPMAEAA